MHVRQISWPPAEHIVRSPSKRLSPTGEKDGETMTQTNFTLLIVALVVFGLAGIATSLWRISRGGLQAMGAIISLVVTAGMLIFSVYIMYTFQNVSNAVGPGSSSPWQIPQYTPIPFSTVPIYSPFEPPTQGPGSLGN
jgi:hypothetical protein